MILCNLSNDLRPSHTPSDLVRHFVQLGRMVVHGWAGLKFGHTNSVSDLSNALSNTLHTQMLVLVAEMVNQLGAVRFPRPQTPAQPILPSDQWRPKIKETNERSRDISTCCVLPQNSSGLSVSASIGCAPGKSHIYEQGEAPSPAIELLRRELDGMTDRSEYLDLVEILDYFGREEE
ncbi:hypothetical protein J6590_089184 [Homalodisca vitripennis]|nr:hypothetical protein J6590_089184 [Homalodisca vitripennis]